jgi:hypothetical protein
MVARHGHLLLEGGLGGLAEAPLQLLVGGDRPLPLPQLALVKSAQD